MDKRVSLATIMAALTAIGASACSKATAPAGASKDPAAAGPATPSAQATPTANPTVLPGAPSPEPAPSASSAVTGGTKSSEAAPSAQPPPPPRPVATAGPVKSAVDAVDAGRAGPKPNANMSCGAGVCGAGMDKKKK